jgi:hypothetical protein
MTDVTEKEITDVAEYFRYLDTLRDSGVTNMFGAEPYLREAFELDKPTARKFLTAWMKTFDDESHPEDRAKKYLETA